MKHRIGFIIVLMSFLCLIASLCKPASADGEAERIHVFVSIVPQEYFVERLGGNRVEVESLVKPDSSPATYDPTPLQISRLSRSGIYFTIGVPFENAFVPKIRDLMPDLLLIDTARGIRKRQMSSSHSHDLDEASGCDGCSTPGAPDPHIWLDPHLVKIQAANTTDALIQIDPEFAAYYRSNFRSFAQELDDMDTRLRDTLKPLKGTTFMVYHPAWGYFADRYGLNQEAIEIEGKEPSARQLARIIQQAKADKVQVIFVQPQFSTRLADRLAQAIGGTVIPINPLARNYLENLKQVADKIKSSLLNP